VAVFILNPPHFKTLEDHHKRNIMKLLYALQLLIIHFAVSLAIGIMTNNLDYQFFSWVAMGVPVVLIIGFFFIPGNKRKKTGPVENEEIFDHLFISKK
jgi:hypothetical protein